MSRLVASAPCKAGKKQSIVYETMGTFGLFSKARKAPAIAAQFNKFCDADKADALTVLQLQKISNTGVYVFVKVEVKALTWPFDTGSAVSIMSADM